MTRRDGVRGWMPRRDTVYGTSVAAPAPTISSLSPSSATQWDAVTTVTVNGTGFTADATVYMGATALATTYVSGIQLTATVPAAENAGSPLQTAGTPAVTVQQTSGTSAGSTFTISAWTFSTPGNLTMTLDPGAGVTLNGSTVSAWTDQTSGAVFAQTSAGLQPTFVSSCSQLNNRPALNPTGGTSSGTINRLDTTTHGDTLAKFVGASAGTMIAVFYNTAFNDNGTTLQNSASLFFDSSVNWVMSIKGNSTAVEAFCNTSNNVSTSVSLNTGYAFGARYASSTIYSRFGLGAETSTSAAAALTRSSNCFMFIGNANDGRSLQGFMGHVLAWNVSLASLDYDRAMRKLKVYYGI